MQSVLPGVPCERKDTWNGRGDQAAMAVTGSPIAARTHREEGTWRLLASQMTAVSRV
jgi:hypothetical protein